MRVDVRAATAVLLALGTATGHAQTAIAPPAPKVAAAPAAAPKVAAPPAVPSVPIAPAVPTPPPSDAVVAKALMDASARFAAQDCAGVLAALDPIAPAIRADDPRLQPIQRLRLSCFLPAGRAGEIEPLYAQLIRATPRDATLRILGVAIAMDQRLFPLAAQRLAAVAEDQPAALAAVQTSLVKQLREAIAVDRSQKALAERLDLALATANWLAVDEPDVDDAIHASAVAQFVRREDLGQARTQLVQIDSPEILVDLALDRREASIWPDIKAQLGDHGALAIDAFAANNLEAFARTPGDDRTLRDAVRSFILLSRPQDAIDLASRVVVVDKMSQELVTTVTYQAEALAFLGRRDEALARLKEFEPLDLRATPSAVNALVLYTELLDEAGHPDQSLSVVRATRDKARAVLSPWGLGWLQRSEACALATLAQAAPAKAAGDLLVTQADANPAAAIEGLLCLGRRDEAAKIAVKTLAMPDGADMLADQFQPAGALWVAPPSRLRALWTPLLARPDVKSAFDKVARILPKELWPSPQPRPIPRAGSAPTGRHMA